MMQRGIAFSASAHCHLTNKAAQPTAAAACRLSPAHMQLPSNCSGSISMRKFSRTITSAASSNTPGSSNSSSSSSKDEPDMSARSGRRVKIPTPGSSKQQQQQQGSSSLDQDATSHGVKERALLMAFMDSLDPNMQQQFAAFMDEQLQQLQQQQQEGASLGYMQRVLEQSGRAAGPEGDPEEWIGSDAGRAAMWESLRGQFSPAEVSLLDDVLGREWQSFGARALSAATAAKIAGLGPDQQAALSNILSKLSDMTGQMDALSDRIQKDIDSPVLPPKKSSSSSSSSSNGGGSSKSSWGASFRRKKSDRVSRGGGSNKGSRRGAGFSGAASAAGFSEADAAKAAEQYWDTLMDKETTTKMQKMMSLAGQAARGQLQWGLPASRHFKTLTQVYQQMVQLELAQLKQPSITPEQVQQGYAAVNSALNKLVAMSDDIQDTATRSALLYMDAVFNNSSLEDDGDGCSSSSSMEVTDAEAAAAAAAAAESAAAGQVSPAAEAEAEAKTRSESQSQTQPKGSVNPRRLQRLGRFLQAAGNLEAFQTWLSVFAERHPHLASEEMLFLSNLGGDDWFVKPELQSEAFEAAQAAAAAAAVQSSSSGGRGSGADISAALAPYIDESRIEALAVLDEQTLWFLAELEANEYSEDVLLKWSLHPDIGPKLMGGKWLNELDMSEPLRKLYRQAQVPEFMEGLNFDILKPRV